MKKTIILIITTLVVSLGATATVGIVFNNRTYSAEETDGIVAELQDRLNETKTDLDKQIEKLTQDYKAKDKELLASITANQKALSDLDVKYAAEVALLTQADESNQKAINDLNTAYVSKVAELTAADTANANAIAELKATYEAKVEELEAADSMVLGHDYYVRLVSKIVEHLTKRKNSYEWCQSHNENFEFNSWIDSFIMGDVYILGSAFDPSEIDLWWLLNRKDREKATHGKVYFFEPFQKSQKDKFALLRCFNVEVEHFDTKEDVEKQIDFISFYKSAIEKIREKVTK